MESRNTTPPGAETGLNRERSQRNPAEQPAGQQAVNAALAAGCHVLTDNPNGQLFLLFPDGMRVQLR